MHDDIKNPMTRHKQPADERAATIFRFPPVQRAKEHAEQRFNKQAMGDRIPYKMEAQKRILVLGDFYRFNTGQEQNRPQQIPLQKRAIPTRREAQTAWHKAQGRSDLEPCIPHLHLFHRAHIQEQSDRPPSRSHNPPNFRVISQGGRLLTSVICRCQPNEGRLVGPQTRASAPRVRRETCIHRQVSHLAMYCFLLGGPARARRQRSDLPRE